MTASGSVVKETQLEQTFYKEQRRSLSNFQHVTIFKSEDSVQAPLSSFAQTLVLKQKFMPHLSTTKALSLQRLVLEPRPNKPIYPISNSPQRGPENRRGFLSRGFSIACLASRRLELSHKKGLAISKAFIYITKTESRTNLEHSLRCGKHQYGQIVRNQ
jgi:hypothetical protein